MAGVLSALDEAGLLAAGVAAGVVGTAGGITSLISYPALLVAGVPALAANATNIVALVACWPGSALASLPELEGSGAWVLRWSALAAGAGAAGAGLLLVTPPGAFTRLVPALILVGALGLLLQPLLARRLARRRASTGPAVLGGGLAAVMVYNGYFGAGAGIMTLALLLLTVDGRLPRANALKNMLVGAATLASAVILTVSGRVEWGGALPLAVGMFGGSTLGPVVARRVPAGVLRWLVALSGIGLAVRLWVAPG